MSADEALAKSTSLSTGTIIMIRCSYLRYSGISTTFRPRRGCGGLWRARDLVVLGFMDKEERAKLTERHALDLRKERCLLKMIKHRKRNKREP